MRPVVSIACSRMRAASASRPLNWQLWRPRPIRTSRPGLAPHSSRHSMRPSNERSNNSEPRPRGRCWTPGVLAAPSSPRRSSASCSTRPNTRSVMWGSSSQRRRSSARSRSHVDDRPPLFTFGTSGFIAEMPSVAFLTPERLSLERPECQGGISIREQETECPGASMRVIVSAVAQACGANALAVAIPAPAWWRPIDHCRATAGAWSASGNLLVREGVV